jgi:hypothetical protein
MAYSARIALENDKQMKQLLTVLRYNRVESLSDPVAWDCVSGRLDRPSTVSVTGIPDTIAGTAP